MSSLSALLSQRARTDGARVALSFKEQGAWRELDWSRVEFVTSSLRSALSEAGFGADGVLLLSKQPSALSVLAALAALSLGGTVAGVGEAKLGTRSAPPAWAFARNSAEFVRLLEAAPEGALRGILFDDRRAAAPVRSSVPVLRYSTIAPAQPSTSVPVLATERCVLELDLTRDSEARQLVLNWLAQGFELGVPEQANSVERDAAELEVSLRVASSHGWEAWAQALRARFAVAGSRKRRFIEWALAVNAQPLARSRWARWVSAWLVVRPLRRALRLGQWRRAASLDVLPPPETIDLLSGLGVRLEPWEHSELVAFHAPDEVTAIEPASRRRAGELARQSA